MKFDSSLLTTMLGTASTADRLSLIQASPKSWDSGSSIQLANSTTQASGTNILLIERGGISPGSACTKVSSTAKLTCCAA